MSELTEMRWLSEKGDTKLIFDPDNPDEVEAAEVQFNDLVAKGFTAYEVEKDGSQGSKMKKFKAKAGRIILVPKLKGG